MRNASASMGTVSRCPDGNVTFVVFQRSRTDHLPDAGLDVADLSEDELVGHQSVGDPAVFALDSFEHEVVPIGEVLDDMIVVVRIVMPGVQGGHRSSDKNRVRNQFLEASRRFEHTPQQCRARSLKTGIQSSTAQARQCVGPRSRGRGATGRHPTSCFTIHPPNLSLLIRIFP